MTTTGERRLGRPPKTSRQQILDAAALFDPTGLQMTALARELDVSVQTIYYYFPSRRALLAALTERAVAQMRLPRVKSCKTWRAVLSEAARHAYRVSMSQQEWAGTAAPVGVVTRAVLLVVDRLVELGIPEQKAFQAYIVVSNWAMAAGQTATQTRSVGGLGRENVERIFADYADSDDVNRLAGLMGSVTLEQLFDLGLSVVLDGLDTHLNTPQQGT